MFALCDANSFYASVERIFQPDLLDRPVVVLSNNDGCIVARSKAAKKLGIDMQKPFFQIKHILEQNNVAVFSSNYTLYADMSRRFQEVLRQFSDELEVYSIDESFLRWTDDLPWLDYGRQIASTVLQWTGLPVCVGFGPSKTLAKLANRLAKKSEGVKILDSTESIVAALQSIELKDIWGISGGLCRRLAILGITTPMQLHDANPHFIRKHLGVVGQKMVLELRGEECTAMELERPDKQNICCSRSFGKVTNDPHELREAVASFACQAAHKMRRQDLVAERVGVFVQTDRHADVEQYGASWGTRLLAATNDSRVLANSAAWCLSQIFRPQHQYKKAGVLLLDLCKRETAQKSLFVSDDRGAANRLMMTMDRINRLFGRGAIRLASASTITLKAGRTWHLRSDHCSRQYTTRWHDLPVAVAMTGSSLLGGEADYIR